MRKISKKEEKEMKNYKAKNKLNIKTKGFFNSYFSYNKEQGTSVLYFFV